MLLLEDHVHEVRLDKQGQVDPSDSHHLGGPCHTLLLHSSKSKRISHSTCHAETNAGYKVNQSAQFIALRWTELLRCTNTQHKASDMMSIFDSSAYEIRIDHCTDCMDFWQLCCGIKGVPSDKNSRLAVLSMREERLSGRIRHFMHFPTEAIIVDGLTKSGLFKLLMEHLTTGRWMLTNLKKPITIRTVSTPRAEYDERDLLDLQE